MARKRQVTPNQIQKILQLTKEGKRRPEIVKEVGVSYRTVYKYQKLLGVL